ncbi:MAG: XisI protein [Leptospiraceae bacterium]|nr:XisI protein [Leptospiraceae bacterium]MCP5497640.1 XisI protein [Leptospiraceae bacterium]
MDKLDFYKKVVKEVVEKYAVYGVNKQEEDVKTEIFIDNERNQYLLFEKGWRDYDRIYGCFLHIGIQNGKIWVEHDGTSVGIANELIEKGIPKEDIVLAFHPVKKRQYTGFAVGV